MRTRVIGMLGAFGKMNWTSSNLLRRRQFSARKILRVLASTRLVMQPAIIPASPTISKSVSNNDSRSVALEGRYDQWLGSHDDSSIGRLMFRSTTMVGTWGKLYRRDDGSPRKWTSAHPRLSR